TVWVTEKIVRPPRSIGRGFPPGIRLANPGRKRGGNDAREGPPLGEHAASFGQGGGDGRLSSGGPVQPPVLHLGRPRRLFPSGGADRTARRRPGLPSPDLPP